MFNSLHFVSCSNVETRPNLVNGVWSPSLFIVSNPHPLKKKVSTLSLIICDTSSSHLTPHSPTFSRTDRLFLPFPNIRLVNGGREWWAWSEVRVVKF